MLCLGLLAVAQAYDASKFTPLVMEENSLVVTEDLEPSISSANHHHRHSWGPPHDPADHHYWHGRLSVKADLLACLQAAIVGFDKDVPSTWTPAAERVAACVAQFFDGCHDEPDLPADFTKSVPYVLFINGIEALAADPTGLLRAETIFSWYLLGSQATIGEGAAAVPNPYYTGANSCASKLAGLLMQAEMLAQSPGGIKKLAYIVVEFLKKTVLTTGGNLGACAPDVPAVLLAITSTYCPASKELYNPFTFQTSACTPTAPGLRYENSPGALLSGSILTLLLLSGNARLANLAYQYAFAANRIALAATQTTDFASCLGFNAAGPTYNGELKASLDAIYKYSGALGVTSGPQAFTPLSLGPDGQRVVCAAIAMVSGPGLAWENNLLWQAQADIVNAVAKTINTQGVVISNQAKQGLCAFTRAAYTFVEANLKTDSQATQYVTIYEENVPATQIDSSCISDSDADNCGANKPSFLTIEPLLATGHDLSATSVSAQVCPN